MIENEGILLLWFTSWIGGYNCGSHSLWKEYLKAVFRTVSYYWLYYLRSCSSALSSFGISCLCFACYLCCLVADCCSPLQSCSCDLFKAPRSLRIGHLAKQKSCRDVACSYCYAYLCSSFSFACLSSRRSLCTLARLSPSCSLDCCLLGRSSDYCTQNLHRRLSSDFHIAVFVNCWFWSFNGRLC